MQTIISKFQKPTVYLIILLIGCALVDCTPVKKAMVEVQQVLLGEGAAGLAKADIYLPKNSARIPALIIASLDINGRKKWADFSHKFARSNHAVLVLDGAMLNDATTKPAAVNPAQLMRFAIDKLKAIPLINQQRIVVLGVGNASLDALRAAAGDTTIAGVIALSPPYPKDEKELANSLELLAPRPFLMIASMTDPRLPAEMSQKFYQAASEPKKLVWLATDKQGEEILATDQEPIVRRVISMLVDRQSR